MAALHRPVAWLLPLAIWMCAAEPRAGEVKIEVLGPARVRVSDPEKLASACQTNPDMPLLACTIFGIRPMECRCDREGAQWSMTIAAQIVPVLLLGNYTQAEWHERLHVTDVATRLTSYLQRVAAIRFDTEADCARIAVYVSNQDSMLQHMKLYARQSNAWLQCAKEGARIPPEEAAQNEIFPDATLARADEK